MKHLYKRCINQYAVSRPVHIGPVCEGFVCKVMCYSIYDCNRCDKLKTVRGGEGRSMSKNPNSNLGLIFTIELLLVIGSVIGYKLSERIPVEIHPESYYIKLLQYKE